MPKAPYLFLFCFSPFLLFGQKSRIPVHMRVLAGGSYASIKVTGITNSVKAKPIFTLGAEVEVFAPTEKEKYSALFNSSYNAYPNTSTQIGNRIVSIQYKTFDFQLGGRYYMFLGETTRLYINPSFVYYVPVNSQIDNQVPKSGVTYSVTAGCAFDRFNVELRFYPERNIVSDTDISARYSSYSFLVGYQIF